MRPARQPVAALRRLRRHDRGLFDVVSRTRLPGLGPLLPPLGRLADHSVLWALIAAALALRGGRRERRAALRGLGAVGLASLVTNQPAKRLFRRGRPSLTGVPVVRHGRRGTPASHSFPSGHAASAFAFALGAGAELPLAARGPLVALAGAVGLSRVYVGVHYPGDVVAGAAIGAAVAAASLRVWPLPDVPPGAGPFARMPAAPAPASTDGDGLALVVNPGAGSAPRADELRRRLPAARIIECGAGQDLAELLSEAAAGARMLGVDGGDGSASAAVAAARAAGLPLLVLPGGTLNHLCRDLGLESVDDALEALAAGRAIRADVGTFDGETFVNTASLGSYPEFVALRERLERRLGKLPAMVVAGVSTLVRAEPSLLEIDGRRTRVWLIFIGNCRYLPDGPAPSARRRLDDGLLDVRLLVGEHPFARLRLLGAILAGRAAGSPVLRAWCAERLDVRSLEGPLRTAHDGEVSPAERAGFTVAKDRGAVVLYTA